MKLQPLAAVPALARCPASAKRLQCTTEAIANADHVLNGHQEKQGILRWPELMRATDGTVPWFFMVIEKWWLDQWKFIAIGIGL